MLTKAATISLVSLLFVVWTPAVLAENVAIPAPINLQAADTTLGQEIKLTWERPLLGLLINYDIYRSATEGSLGSRIVHDFRGEEYLDTKVQNGIQYYYTVVAFEVFNESNRSRSSKIASALATDLQPPDPPTSIKAEASSKGQITVFWGSPKKEKAASYILYRSTAPDLLGNRIINTSSQSFKEYGLPGGVSYYYSVKAIDTSGNISEASAQASVSTVNNDDTPLSASDLKVQATGRDGETTISWKNPSLSNFSFSRLYRGVNKEDKGNLIVDRIRGQSFGDKNLVNGQQYYYTVQSVSKGGVEYESNTQVSASPFIKKSGAPPPVSGLEVSDLGDGASLQLQWQNPALHLYNQIKIYRSVDTEAEGEVIASGLRLSRYKDDKGVETDTRYYYTVKTVDKSGVESVKNRPVGGIATIALAGEGEDNDTDNDGLTDVWERKRGYHPRLSDPADQDDDNDGLGILEEYQNGSDPWNSDTDGDGYDDGTEVANNFSPLGQGLRNRSQNVADITQGDFAYHKKRLSDLSGEQRLAAELKQELEQRLNASEIPVSRKNWFKLINAYVYGGYDIREITDTLRNGPGLVHPDVSAQIWRQSDEYKRKNI